MAVVSQWSILWLGDAGGKRTFRPMAGLLILARRGIVVEERMGAATKRLQHVCRSIGAAVWYGVRKGSSDGSLLCAHLMEVPRQERQIVCQGWCWCWFLRRDGSIFRWIEVL